MRRMGWALSALANGISAGDTVARNVPGLASGTLSCVSVIFIEEHPLKSYWPFSLSPTVRDTPLTWLARPAELPSQT